MLLDLLFPPICVACSKQGMWLCSQCVAGIEADKEPAECFVCGDPSLTGRTCAECRRITPLDGLIATGSYRHATLRAAVHALKFDGVTALAKPLAAILVRRVATALTHENADPDDMMVVPIPLHRRREQRRGFNQAALISAALSRGLALPHEDLLIRNRATAPQTTILTGATDARKNNLIGAFIPTTTALHQAPTRVILVDDVATTGSSLEAAAQVLYDLGVRSVWGAVICKG